MALSHPLAREQPADQGHVDLEVGGGHAGTLSEALHAVVAADGRSLLHRTASWSVSRAPPGLRRPDRGGTDHDDLVLVIGSR